MLFSLRPDAILALKVAFIAGFNPREAVVVEVLEKLGGGGGLVGVNHPVGSEALEAGVGDADDGEEVLAGSETTLGNSLGTCQGETLLVKVRE